MSQNVKLLDQYDQHEYQLIKQNNLPMINSFMITNIQGNVECLSDGEQGTLETGTLIGVGNLISTNSGRVEIRSRFGTIYRLEMNSWFKIQDTAEGEIPVVYGNVYVDKTNSSLEIMDEAKYRTSCYFIAKKLITESIDETDELYVTLENSANVYEYDENGQKFQIMHLEPYSKRLLSFQDVLKMRNRYVAGDQQQLTKVEIEEYYSRYVIPTKWR